jgi:hypothetical protein
LSSSPRNKDFDLKRCDSNEENDVDNLTLSESEDTSPPQEKKVQHSWRKEVKTVLTRESILSRSQLGMQRTIAFSQQQSETTTTKTSTSTSTTNNENQSNEKESTETESKQNNN